MEGINRLNYLIQLDPEDPKRITGRPVDMREALTWMDDPMSIVCIGLSQRQLTYIDARNDNVACLDDHSPEVIIAERRSRIGDELRRDFSALN